MIRTLATRRAAKNISARVQLALVEVSVFETLNCGVSQLVKSCWQIWREYGEQPKKIVGEFRTFEEAREAYEI